MFEEVNNQEVKTEHQGSRSERIKKFPVIFPPKTKSVEVNKYWKPQEFSPFNFIDHSIPYLIKGLIPENKITCIHGEGGTGKSSLALLMAMSLASGEDFLGYKVGEETPILVIQSEDDANTLNSRIHSLCVGNENLAKATLNNNLVFAGVHGTARGYSLSEGEHCLTKLIKMQLENYYAEHGKFIKVLVVDPIASYLDCDENSSIPVRKALDRLIDVCARFSLTCIVIHHNNKMGSSMRGSTSFQDTFRTVYSLENVANNDPDFLERTKELPKENVDKYKMLWLRKEKSNDISPKINIKFVNNNFCYSRLYKKQETENEIPQDPIKPFLIDFLKARGNKSKNVEFLKEVMKQKDCSRSTAEKYIKGMVSEGVVEKKGAGPKTEVLLKDAA